MGADVVPKKGPKGDINMTPLIDIVLVLLIIFMVLTPIMEKEIGVRVPEQDEQTELTPPPEDLPQQTVFRVDPEGNFWINNERITEENAGDRLKAYYRQAKAREVQAGPPVIFFDAADQAKYERAVRALDLIRDSAPRYVIGMVTEKIANAPGAGAPADGAPAAPPAPQQ